MAKHDRSARKEGSKSTANTRRRRDASCSFCRKSYQEVGPLVEGPGNVFICGECIELCQSIIVQEKRRRHFSQAPYALPLTPDEIKAKLDQYVLGQERIKRILAAAVHRHYERLRLLERGKDDVPGEKSHIFLIGPGRSARVLFARALAQIMEVPFALGDVVAFAETEQAAPAVEPLLYHLLEASGFYSEAAERGIVYLEGMDQVAQTEPNRGSFSAEGRLSVGPNLLRMLNGMVSRVFPTGPGEPFQSAGIQLDTTGILFLCGGTFAGLGRMVARRIRGQKRAGTEGLPAEIVREDLLAFGLSPDLVGPLPIIASVARLDEETLVRLMTFAQFRFPES
jgi:ATP-dependent Clp protease ATP-binding subunit ClpX